MKKTFLLFAIALIIVSCNDSSKDDIQLNSINLKVNSSDWVANIDNSGIIGLYSTHLNIPEITQGVFSSGVVNAYIVSDNDPTAQEPLPYVRHYQDLDGTLWTQTIDFDYSIGGMNVYVTNSNFSSNHAPATLSFRVVIQ